ncbi:MAG: hypothetical protein ACI4PH_08920 [Faecousia sp.]
MRKKCFLSKRTASRPEPLLDDQIQARIRTIYQYYKVPENLAEGICYLTMERFENNRHCRERHP